jgi:hypothetical protein
VPSTIDRVSTASVSGLGVERERDRVEHRGALLGPEGSGRKARTSWTSLRRLTLAQSYGRGRFASNDRITAARDELEPVSPPVF